MKVVFVSPDGGAAEVAAAPADSVMFAALSAGIDGILGECGGCAVCGTCHVHVDAAAAHLFPPADEVEEDLLDHVAGRGPTSRLGCRLVLGEEHDGLVLRLPGSR